MSAGIPIVTRARRYQAVVIGCSAGGLAALRRVLGPLPAHFPLPVIIVAHTGPGGGALLAEVLDHECTISVGEAAEKAFAQPGHAYISPGGYHLLMEADGSFSLSVDARIANVRPAINVLFESAADAYGGRLIGVLLTGANDDGTDGCRAIREAGGLCIVQDPATADADLMPRSCIKAGLADRIVTLAALPELLCQLAGEDP